MRYRHLGVLLSSFVCLGLVSAAGTVSKDHSDICAVAGAHHDDFGEPLDIDNEAGSTSPKAELVVQLAGEIEPFSADQIEIVGDGEDLELFVQSMDESRRRYKSSPIRIKNNSRHHADVYIDGIDVYVDGIKVSDKSEVDEFENANENSVTVGILDPKGNVVSYKERQKNQGPRWECNLAEIPGRYLLCEKLPPGESCELFVITTYRCGSGELCKVNADLKFSSREVPPPSAVHDSSKARSADLSEIAFGDDKEIVPQSRDGKPKDDGEIDPHPEADFAAVGDTEATLGQHGQRCENAKCSQGSGEEDEQTQQTLPVVNVEMGEVSDSLGGTSDNEGLLGVAREIDEGKDGKTWEDLDEQGAWDLW
ncbi:MAG: hypothetical protein LBB04_02410 [Oscillospiraceae bacterium]|jgi:hypothetical protein|nr:hypothetical protein [Oscillospiraceae bacterium]